ncbi:hypothetical protein ATK78_2959 [Pedobacter metabolipauper]|uniref:Uncharacterized protein n=1 Tax=Pedobacter metabolipauper TaxID=425513 RepID=A0A4R6SSS6_9SPHI|nr:hypothetical protein ATK78_2959 [Pedobacter metabolipauper]
MLEDGKTINTDNNIYYLIINHLTYKQSDHERFRIKS